MPYVRVYDDAGNVQSSTHTDRDGKLFLLQSEVQDFADQLPLGWYVEDDKTGTQYMREES
jgi:hypothetical protein